MADTVIEIRDLTKSYGNVEAVRGVDLDVARGEVFAMLGPNGAGKTTTVEILEGHRRRTSGEVLVLGHDPGAHERAYRARIGIVLQETGVEPHLTVQESIELYRGYYPAPRPVDEVLELVGLSAQRDTRVRKLSGGQQRRLDVAIGLAGDPELLFLDEPTTGFDPSARRQAWDMVKNLATLGKTVFLTTHYMDEAQFLADRVAIIVAGRIVAQGPPSALAARGVDETRVRFHLPPDAGDLPASLAAASSEVRTPDGREVEIMTATPARTLHELSGWALEQGRELDSLVVSQPSLEDVYLQLTAEAPGDHGESDAAGGDPHV